MGKKLTLRPGVRYEQQKLIGSAPAPGAELCFEGDTVPGRGDGTGSREAPAASSGAATGRPRIGATYDIKGDGRSKIFASFGRFFTKIPNDLAARAMSADAGISRADYFDANLTQPVPNGALAGGRDATLHPRRSGRLADLARLEVQLPATRSWAASSSRSASRRQRRRALHPPHGARGSWRTTSPRPSWPSTSVARARTPVEYLINNISPSLPRFNCAPTVPLPRPSPAMPAFEDPVPQVRLGRVHGQQDLLQQLVADGVVPLVEAAGHLRRRLPQRQRAVRSLDHVAVRLPDQRPELHRRSAPASSATAATSATRAARWAAASCPTTGRTR